ncbi:sigma-70 family RNA polymerase sigma factor [Cellulomonas sp. NPDC089187]|uniref:RNA polymerase sigma factor n=1 Tax=Cellulomonas sp. NPDC089187 TaxID=3154970 RepID=UPI00343BA3FB
MAAGGEGGEPAATVDAVAAFGDLYRSLVPHLRGFIRRQVPHEQVDDVLSETFLVVWRRWNDLPEPERIRPWVYGVARNRIRKAHDDRGRTALGVDLVAADAYAHEPDPADQLAADDRARRLVALLPEAEADAMTLTVWGGLTPTEAARELGCSVTALTSRLSRARTRLAGHLALELDTEGERR